jgi:hypothetical protein
MVEHMVLLKFSSATTQEQKEQVIQRTLQLKEEIPGIVDIQQGFNFSSRSQGFEIGLTVRFEDRSSLENYGPHPSHQAVFTYLKEIGLEDIIIVDFDIE